MQHDGYLETSFSGASRSTNSPPQPRFHGDELTLRPSGRPVSAPGVVDVGPQGGCRLRLLRLQRVVAGKAGLPKFEADLTAFVKRTLAQRSRQVGPASRVVLAIAHEDLKDDNLPDGKETTGHLALYTAAMKKVAASRRSRRRSLSPTKASMTRPKTPLTINGSISPRRATRSSPASSARALFGDPAEALPDAKILEALRKAVVDKNFFWHQRYRTVDGYSIYGGRADLSFVKGQTNPRRDEARDGSPRRDDGQPRQAPSGPSPTARTSSQRREHSAVQSRRHEQPGPLQGGQHVFLDPEKAIER